LYRWRALRFAEKPDARTAPAGQESCPSDGDSRSIPVDPETFKAMQPLLDRIAEIADKQFNSEELRRLMAELGDVVGEKYSASVRIVVDAFDANRECLLPLLDTGLSAVYGKEPYRTWDDSTLQRYVVEDGIKVVPHDRCPKCWQMWISS
jgi:hypothetical protein